MFLPFVHDVPVATPRLWTRHDAKLADEVARLGATRALVIATPAAAYAWPARRRDAGKAAAGLHAQAAMHVPRGHRRRSRRGRGEAKANALIAVGGGSAIGLAKAVAHATELPIIALPTTYSGSEATACSASARPIRKTVNRDANVLPKTIVYDAELTLALPAGTSAASGMNAMAHGVEAMWVPDRTPVTTAYGAEALRIFVRAASARGGGRKRYGRARRLSRGRVARGRLALERDRTASQARAYSRRLGTPACGNARDPAAACDALQSESAENERRDIGSALGGDPGTVLAALMKGFPIPQRLRDVGMTEDRLAQAADKAAALAHHAPRVVHAR